MTIVNSTTPTQAITAESADPPTIKNAGKLEPAGSSALIMALLVLGIAAFMAGGMLLAVMASHGQRRRGLLLHGALGAAGVTLFLVAYFGNTGSYQSFETALLMAAELGVLWLVIAGMALAVALARPPKAKPRV